MPASPPPRASCSSLIIIYFFTRSHTTKREKEYPTSRGARRARKRAMNDAMESRVEALAFQYVGLGLFTVVNNLWTLVAVVTAAVSVWSIRAAAGSSTVRRRHQPRPPPPCVDGNSMGRPDGPGPIPERRPADAADESAPAALGHSSATSSAAASLVDGVTKGRRKFTAYYKDDGGCERVGAAEAEEEVEEARGGGSCGGGEWWESWERVLKARNGEMSWYLCQDTGVINGAVVRLWDESRRGSGRMDGSRCEVW